MVDKHEVTTHVLGAIKVLLQNVMPFLMPPFFSFLVLLSNAQLSNAILMLVAQ